ncbi:hypothetical protein diail_5536 [Diaporthe ilicicola]|nr:hypothetical protein diail_5536 [Diaporthe ilicicola]
MCLTRYTPPLFLGDAQQWMKNRPETCSPVFICKEEDKPFPEICLLNDNVVLGLQYYHLVRILLIAYDPGIPRLGLEQKAAVRSMDEALREDVRIVCGIADAISRVNNAHLAASMAIALAGDRFDDPDEQQALMDVLVRTERALNWSTLPARGSQTILRRLRANQRELPSSFLEF